ncbi:MAG: hypothetical protein IM541_01425 [Chitinophagaceae bacterium]|jgi:hypothetical protein|nr:hypothetical protein [Cytophagales bacterium]MCA6462948.1 hypothetical protein [Chitinophagaceae bacterium]MCA6471531.1 hypothetical protein [Chitinophagaceae bacterium]MCA6474481.1 hypothetical protein [Chitinophagaceae bacterium]MCA6477230.1 hypothetical protein [Chitinophagaceae bacterium]
MKKISLRSLLMLITVPTLFAQCRQQGSASKPVDIEKEKAAILAVIKKETETYYAKNLEGWKSTYLQSPRFRHHAYWEGYDEKVRGYNGFDNYVALKKQAFDTSIHWEWDNTVVERSNENFNISHDMAWYTFDEVSHEKGTNKFLGKAIEARVLEKVNGEWKIAYLGYHYYPLKDSIK